MTDPPLVHLIDPYTLDCMNVEGGLGGKVTLPEHWLQNEEGNEERQDLEGN